MQNKKIWIAMSCLMVLCLLPLGCGEATPPVAEDTFIHAVANDVPHLDPHRIGATGESWYYGNRALTDWSLLDWHIVPALAESWENIDPLTWKFTLRQGLKFSNGQPLTSEDVQFSIYRMLGKLDPDLPVAGTAMFSFIDEVETPDDYTVIIHCNSPEISFLTMCRWLTIVPKAYVEAVGDDEFAKNPVGAGPYRIVDHKIQESLTLEANEYYYNTNPEPGTLGPSKIKTVIYRIIPEEQTRLAALKVGEVDAIYGISPDNAKALEEDPNIRVYYSQGNTPSYILINWRTEKDPETGEPNPFRDVRVRQALNYALDIDAIIDNYLTGHERRTTMLGYGGIGYNPDVPFYEYNPDKARQLLAEAGYPNGFTTKFYAWAGVAPEMEAMLQYWRDVGIDAKIELTTRPVVMKALMRHKGASLYGLIPWADGHGPDPASTFLKACAKYDGPNALHGKNERVEELVDKQMTEFDVEKRAETIDEIIQIMWKDAWFVPLWEAVSIRAIRDEWDYVDMPITTGFVPTNVSRKK